MTKGIGQNRKTGRLTGSSVVLRNDNGLDRSFSNKKTGAYSARVVEHTPRTGVTTAKVKRVSDDGVVVVVDSRQRAHAFDADEIKIRRASRQSSRIEVGETVTITSENGDFKVTLG